MRDLDERTETFLKDVLVVAERFKEQAPEATVANLWVFLYIAIHGPISQIEVCGKLGMSTSSMSRSIAALSDLPNGAGLLTWLPHPTDRRTKLVTTTFKGAALASRMVPA